MADLPPSCRETVGNYYSLRRDHEKAILYFRRALKLDKSYLSAWTLMGHEYVEIKNTNAAIASYRRAVGEFFRSSSSSHIEMRELTRVGSIQMSTERITEPGMVLGRLMNYSRNHFMRLTIIRKLRH